MQGLGIPDLEAGSRIVAQPSARGRDVSRGWVDAHNLAGCRVLENGLGKRSGTATDVQPTTSGRYRELPYELPCDEAAPTAHVGFVGAIAVPPTIHSAGSVWSVIHGALSLLVAARVNDARTFETNNPLRES